MKKVLIVDDSLIIRINLKKIFQSNGFEIVGEAVNGTEAYEKYKEHKPDLVTMDITMPIMDGITALQYIRNYDQDAVVIMISALGQEVKIVEALNCGAKQYITKPFIEEDIIKKVSTVLSN